MRLQQSLAALHKGPPPAAVSANMSIIRAKHSRIEVIARTSFPLPAYSLFDSIVIGLITLLVVYSSATPLAGYATIGIFTYLFVYM